MAFVNEYASDEDIEKYGLREIWDKYHPLRKGDYFYGRQPEWTVDEDAQTYFMVINRGTGEYGNRVETLLCLNGNEVVAGLELLDRSSGNLKADPFMIAWGLVRLKLPSDIQVWQSRSYLRSEARIESIWLLGSEKTNETNTVVEFDF